MNAPSPKQARPGTIVTILIIAIGLPSFASTIMIPSMTAIADDFGTSFAAVAIIQSLYLAGLAVPQLVYGGVSDRLGRRPTMLAGQALFVVGSVTCAVAPSLEILTIGRLAEAIGGCAGIALGRAILRDLFPREKAASYLAYMTMAMAGASMLAPIVGGLLQENSGWRAISLFLAVLGFLFLVLSWRALPESSGPGADRPRWSTLIVAFVTLLRIRAFRDYAIPPTCLTGAYQTFAASSAFVAAIHLGIGPAELGLGLVPIVASFILGNFLSGRFGRRIGIDRMIRLGTGISLLFSCAFVLAFTGDRLTPVTFFGAMALINLGQGMSVSNLVASATGAVPGLIGSAAGLTGFLQWGAAAIFATLVGTLVEAHLWILPATMLALAATAFLMSPKAGRA